MEGVSQSCLSESVRFRFLGHFFPHFSSTFNAHKKKSGIVVSVLVRLCFAVVSELMVASGTARLDVVPSCQFHAIVADTVRQENGGE